MPNVIQLGTANCIAAGEDAGELLSGDDVYNGLPRDCFRDTPFQGMTWDAASSYDSCSNQYAYAQIIDWLYAANRPAIFAFLGSYLGPAWTLQYFTGTGPVPDMVTAVSSQGALVWIDGTDNFQQIALQGAGLVQRPRDIGVFSTSQFWYDNSDTVVRNLNTAGANPFGPVFLCGHSYGGVLVALTAARYRIANRSRVIRWLTYGMPKPGDNRLISRLGECPGMALCNDNDLVAAIPPNLVELLPSVLAMVAPQFLVWPDWKAAPYQSRMSRTGIITPGETPTIDSGFISQLMADIIANLPTPTIVGHLLATYQERIIARCRVEEWPARSGDYAELDAEWFIAQEDDFAILQEDGSLILTE